MFVSQFLVVISSCVCFAWAGLQPECNQLKATTTYGTVRGKVLETEETKKQYIAYKGIPYARPPIGDLRFKPPIPPKRWAGVLKTTKEPNSCVQGLKATGSEDCLYLNVYTPKLRKAKLPVMVWIHGGYFLRGNSSTYDYGPDYFLEEDVVVVTLNYRLGVFGFLSTEDEASPGNYALKDQLLALKWVQGNIAAFGGDPDQVTLFGESAGAACTSYLLQSSLAKGLFHKVIMQSGTSLNLWAYTRNASKMAFETGKLFGIKTDNSTVLIDELRKVDYSKLSFIATSHDYLKTIFGNLLEGLEFGPTLEPAHQGAVITGKSHEKLKAGDFNKVPIILGYNSEEGKVFADVLKHIKVYLLQYDMDPVKLAPLDMNIDENSDVAKKVTKAIKKEYFEFQPISVVSDDALSVFLSDDQFVRPITEYARLSSKHTEAYLYNFSYSGLLGDPKRTEPGVGHGEDLYYLWRSTESEDHPSAKDILTRHRLIRLWTNFAKYSNPTPEPEEILEKVQWLPTDPESLTHINIGSSLTIESHPDNKHIKFWQNLYSTYGNPPYDTY